MFIPLTHRRNVLRLAIALVAMTIACALSAAPSPDAIRDIALGEGDAKVDAIRALAVSADPAALPLLQSFLDGEVHTVDDKQVLLVKGDAATDLLTGKAVARRCRRRSTMSSSTTACAARWDPPSRRCA